MCQFHKYIFKSNFVYFFIYFIWCFIFYKINFYFVELTSEINLVENKLFQTFLFFNKISWAFTPIFILFFHLITIKIMFYIYDYEITGSLTMKLLSLSFTPIILTHILIFFVLNILSKKLINKYDYEELMNFNLFIDISLSDLFVLSNISWVLFFIILNYLIVDAYKIKVINSIIISTAPSLLFLIIQNIIYD